MGRIGGGIGRGLDRRGLWSWSSGDGLGVCHGHVVVLEGHAEGGWRIGSNVHGQTEPIQDDRILVIRSWGGQTQASIPSTLQGQGFPV